MLGVFAENQTLSITTDNAHSVVDTIDELKKNEDLFELIHGRCGTHVINLVVRSALDHLEDGFKKIRFVSMKVCFKRNQTYIYILSLINLKFFDAFSEKTPLIHDLRNRS